MHVLRALRLAGRPRRVEDAGHVAGRGLGRLDGLPHDLVARLQGEGGARVLLDVVDLLVTHLRVHGNGHGAGPHGGQAQEEELIAVGSVDHHPVAGFDLGPDSAGHAGDAIGRLHERELEPGVGFLDEGSIAVGLGQALHEVAEVCVLAEGEAKTLAESSGALLSPTPPAEKAND